MFTANYLRTMNRYNQWMNEKLYSVCATMPDESRKADKGAFFKSIHGTLNHLLLTDRVWLGRFTGQPYTVARSLDQELYSDFGELWRERRLTDAALEAWSTALTEAQLAAPFTFVSMSNPTQRTMPLWQLVLHVFNHQTHHRGQMTTIMEQLGYDSGMTDLAQMPLESHEP